jgi:ABC-type dipeptide/oligopeptide/nickel transport system permease component
MLAGATLLATPGLALADHLPSAAHSVPQPIADLAENEDFWANVLRYISYFFSVLLGTAYVAIKPIFELLKRPTTAILVIIGGAALYFFVSTTVGAMLGMNDIIEYEPSSIVTPMQQ